MSLSIAASAFPYLFLFTSNRILKDDLDRLDPEHIFRLFNIFSAHYDSVTELNNIQNVSLEHGEIVFDADNGLLDTYNGALAAQGFGDYVGIKKDDLTAGGTISPGFLLYDAINNQFVGFKGEIKNLAEFENTNVPRLCVRAGF